ncbi:MAG: ABC transporter ATP-binding protein [Eubacteriales bacterium]
MVQIIKVPPNVWQALGNKGIAESDILLASKSDMNRDGVWCDCWLFATAGELLCLAGSSAVVPARQNNHEKKTITTEFKEISYSCFFLSDISDFKVEELISTCRFVAKDKDGVFVLITYLTNTTKDDTHLFIKYISQIKEKGVIEPEGDEKDNKEEKICPKCGNRYADAVRKICPKCMDKGKIIKRTFEFFVKYKLFIGIMVLLLIISSALGVIAPYVSSGFYYDQVLNIAGEYYGELLLVLGIILITRLLSVLNQVFSGVISTSIAAKIVYDLKKVIFSAIERLSISFFTGRQTGGLMTQVNNDANTIYWFFCDGMPYFLVNFVQVIALFIIMLIMNPLLTLLSLITIPIVFFLIRWLFGHMGKLHAKRFGRSRALNSTLSDVLTGVRVVKAFSKEKDEIKRFDRQSVALANAERNMSYFASTAFPLAGFMLYISNIIVWGVGGWMVITGKMTYGILITFIAYMSMIQNPMFFFVDMMNMASDSFNAMQRLIEVMDAVPDVVEKENPAHFTDLQGRVEFKNISFSYVKNRKVIDNVSFDVQPGEKLGIVGHTGAGKSTLANLLIRLYDVNEGEILIDGINVKDIAFEDLRSNVAIVSQETYLFAGTIAENIKYARPDASKLDIIEAAKIAGAHDFIIKLPDSYETKIGFGFKDLSGGERQRISIARAILRNPKILIMDEATAAMDTETERQIQTALERLTKGRTTIMIAHRLSTLRDADKLIVIENGKMPESGTHLDLINKKGIYFNLYKLQVEALRNIGIES